MRGGGGGALAQDPQLFNGSRTGILETAIFFDMLNIMDLTGGICFNYPNCTTQYQWEKSVDSVHFKDILLYKNLLCQIVTKFFSWKIAKEVLGQDKRPIQHTRIERK